MTNRWDGRRSLRSLDAPGRTRRNGCAGGKRRARLFARKSQPNQKAISKVRKINARRRTSILYPGRLGLERRLEHLKNSILEKKTTPQLIRPPETHLTELVNRGASFHCTIMALENAARDWEADWKHGVKPGEMWDVKESHAVLRRFVAEGKVPEGTALVPGCGRGYDVVTLASPTRFAVGVEYAPSGAEVAREFVASAEGGSKKEFCRVDCGDFFKHTPAEAPFDFIYDLTFLCALKPEMRKDWARRMSELAKKGTGQLLALEYPLVSPPGRAADDFNSGPPFLLRQQDYIDLLSPYFDCVEPSTEIPKEDSEPRRAGAERWSLWRRKAE